MIKAWKNGKKGRISHPPLPEIKSDINWIKTEASYIFKGIGIPKFYGHGRIWVRNYVGFMHS
ncbi:hypothetical protein ACQKL5_12245 [Peribacillus sp. NPDC097675]|uniref:hypothetical protein n=1 Tax=Peribacillus sp. NPDC097675 TaxID=3390618 RepID=UPI003D049F7F